MADEYNKNLQETSSTDSGDQSKRLIKIVLIVVGVLLLLGMLGIFLLFQLGENFFESASNAEVERTEQGIKIESEEGTFESQADLPDDFPQEVPIYDEHEVVSSSKITDNESNETTYTATFSTQDEMSEVTEFYESAFEDANWNVTQESTFNNMRQISAEKNNLETTLIINAISDEVSATTFTLTVRKSDE